MPNCHLIVDSCSDVPPEMIDREGITLLKFPYILNGGTFEDDLFQSISAKDFYNGMRKKDQPSTSQLSMIVLDKVFREAAERGVPTVYLSFTSGLSGSYDMACMARDKILEEFPDFELYVVDTLLASLAEGFLVFKAISQWENGASAKELAEWAEEARYFVDCEFMIDDLEALERGGRIPSTVAAAGGALDVKPMMSIDINGKLTLVGISRGRKKGLKSMASYFEKNLVDEGRTKYVFLGHSDCPKDVQRLKELLEKIDSDLIFVTSSIGPVIGSHVGPDMVAMAFWGKDKRQNLSMSDRIAKRLKGDDK